MRHAAPIVAFALVLGSAACRPAVCQAAPGYVLIEAEASPHGQVVPDRNCSGGHYVKTDGDYQPVVIGSLPATGDAFTVWARVRGVALQLKGIGADGGQHDLNWVYDSPAAFTWESFGRHTRAELGTGFLLMRGTGAAADEGVDAVVLASDGGFDPNTAVVTAAPLTARVTVDWAVTTAQTTPLLFGSNDWAAVQDPDGTRGDAAFARQLDTMGISLLRLHNGGLSDAWTDHAARTWDAAKIKAVYDAPYLRGKTILQNIPVWPSWMKQQDGLLDPSEYDSYARFCADLVRIVNVRQHRQVRYWEPLNEQDIAYWQKGKFDDLCALYNKIVPAMKAVDPSIQVGGLAFTWDDPLKVEPFLKACGPNVDFLSWHRYASDGHVPTEKIMADTPGYEDYIKNLRALTVKYMPKRHVPLVWDEFSLSYTWQSPETRQWTNVGAVWFASTLKHMADAGLDMGCQWNLKDGFYGLMSGDDTPRPAATVYAWANHDLVGAVARSRSDQAAVEAMAVRNSGKTSAVLLINKSAGSATVFLTTTGPGAFGKGALSMRRLNADGTASGAVDAATLARGIVMTPYSLVLLRTP